MTDGNRGTRKDRRASRPAKRGRRVSGSRQTGQGIRLPIVGSIGLTVLLRLVYLLTTENPFWRMLGLDLEIYDLWARRILETPPFGGDLLGQAPFFPLALSAAYAVLGADPVRALFAHLLPAALASGAIAWVAGRWKGTAAAWVAGVLAAVHEPSIFYTGVLLPPSWVVGLSALVLALGYRMVLGTAGRLGRFLCGLVLGLLVWAQPVCLVLLLPLIVFADSADESGRPRPLDRRLFWKASRTESRSAWLRTAWLVLGLALPLTFSFVYNASKGAPALVAVNGGINFYIGNGREATGAYVRPLGMEENRDLLGVRLATRLIRSATDPGGAAGGNVPAVAGGGGEGPDSGALFVDRRRADRFWWNRALADIGSNPGRTAQLYLRKLGFFFTNYEIPQVESFPYESRFSWLLRLPLPGMAVLVFGTVLAAGLLVRRDSVARWLLLSVLVLGLGVAAFFVTARFRMPVVPWMIVLAGAAIAEVWRTVRGGGRAGDEAGRVRTTGSAHTGRRSELSLALALALAAGLVSAFAPTGIVTQAADGQYVFRQAVVAEQSGDLERAMQGYRDALEIDPALAKANVNLGTLLARRGQLDEAREYLERGVRLDPSSGIGHQNLGQLYETQGRPDEALAEYEAALAAEPDLLSVRESAAYLLHQRGQIDASRIHLQEILRRVPRGSPPELRAGTLFSLVGERREAMRALVAGGSRPDWWASEDLLLADVLLAQRQIPRSAEYYRKAATDPGVAAYAQLILTQLEASGVLGR